MSKFNHKISLLEVIQILEEHRQNIILNIQQLKEDYQRTGIKRIKGVKDINGEIITPWLNTEDVYPSDYVQMGVFAMNRNSATINMLVKRKVKLVKSQDNTPMIEVAGLLTNDLNNFNNYTIIKDGKLHVKSLRIKISSKKVFDILKNKGVITADKFDFSTEYNILLDEFPLIPLEWQFSNLDGIFVELAEMKVLSSIVAACLRHKSDLFVEPQIEELRKHYLSKNLYLNFPTTPEFSHPVTIEDDLGVGFRLNQPSHKIEIGNHDILNLGKLYSANKFLARRYEVYDQITGEIFTKPTFDLLFHENIAFRQKAISRRMKFNKVDDLLKPIFDDFLGISENGKVMKNIDKIGAESLAWVLSAKRADKAISQEEMISALTEVSSKLEQYIEEIYRTKISPLVFYIGATGLLPNGISAKIMTAEELGYKYPDLQISKNELLGTFFEVDDIVISVYKQPEFCSQESVCIS